MAAGARRIIFGVGMVMLLAGCGGGSGSTGLITSEGALIDDVRDTGTCSDFDGAPYCATDSPDAVAPGGQSAVVEPSAAAPTPTPIATAASTATPAGGSTPTPVPSLAAPTATAIPSASPTPSAGDPRTVTVAVQGFEAGAACAVAVRPAGSDDAWRTGALTTVDPAGARVTFPVPSGVAEPVETTLVCFADPPTELPATLTTLAAAEPTVVFVLP